MNSQDSRSGRRRPKRSITAQLVFGVFVLALFVALICAAVAFID